MASPNARTSIFSAIAQPINIIDINRTNLAGRMDNIRYDYDVKVNTGRRFHNKGYYLSGFIMDILNSPTIKGICTKYCTIIFQIISL